MFNIKLRDDIVLNLQLFAEEPNIMTTGTPELSPEMKTFYNKALLESATPHLVHEQFGQKKPIPKGQGKKVEFRRPEQLPKLTEPLEEGFTPKAQTLKITAVTAEVAQYGGYTELTDFVQLTAIDPLLSLSAKMLGNQGGLSRDSIVRNALAQTTNDLFATKVGADGSETDINDIADVTEGCELKIKDIMRAVAKMKSNNIQPLDDGTYVAILHPMVAYHLKTKDPTFAEWHKYSDAQKLFKGEIGLIDGCRFVESSEALITGNQGDLLNQGPPCAHTFVIGANAYGVTEVGEGGIEMIVKPIGSGGTSDPLNQRGTVGWKTNITAEILSDEAIIDIISYAPGANINVI